MPTAVLRCLLLFATFTATCGGGATSDELALTLAPRDPNRMGYLTVTGTVRSATVIPKGAQAFLGITVGRPSALGVFDEVVQAPAPADTSSVSWRVKQLASGDAFSFFVGVDLNGDGTIGSGDLGGYYDGSTVLPFSDPGNARLIQVRRDQSGLDFGIGPIR
ncbi:MAG: hypothetical protein SF187_03185 [Deltaproteobacteria bacterium]|nr:hypothetical protein [Deltaproteobacteria bacterium]